MSDYFSYLLEGNFMPHGHCFLWTPDILWSHVISDLIIAIAYYSIPIALWIFVSKRKDLAFNWMFLLFALFIFACGTTHLFDAWNIWHGHYRIEGWIKIGTAAASIVTAILLWPLIPKALALPSPEQLRIANSKLQEQYNERVKAEDALRDLNTNLEQLVGQRTEELKKSNNDLEQFAYIASHDLQQPVRTISNMIQLIERKGHEKFDSESTEYFGLVKDAALKMSKLIRDLLAYSKVGSQKTALQDLDPNDILKATLHDLKIDIEENKVRVHSEKLPIIKYDPSRLSQVFQNLISNAIKYKNGDNPTIWIEAKDTDPYWTFSVRDNGIGIESKYKDMIFELFRRLHSEAEYPGTGIGLSICHRIVEMHGGKVWVESTKGAGATFYFTVPKKG